MESDDRPKVPKKRIHGPIEAINYLFVSEITPRGGSFYVRLDPDLLRWYNLKVGDQLKLHALELRRVVGEE